MKIEEPTGMVGTGRKTLHALFVVQLTFTVFSVLAWPDACLCGQACRPCLFEEVQKQEKVSYHKRCHRDQCKTCNVETVTLFDARELFTRDYRQEQCGPAYSLIVSINSLLNDPTTDPLNTVNSRQTGHSTSHYLQNCSLLL